MSAEQAPALLYLRDITRTFPGVVALDRASFALRRGEIHALLGSNGAGKSTMIKIVAGALRPQAGAILLEGQSVHLSSPAVAQAAGICAVHQELPLVPDLSVAENLLLGREPRGRLGLIDWKALRSRAEEALRRLDLVLDVRAPLRSCPIALQQLVAIARGVDLSSRVLILDEPTSSLDERETQRLFTVMRALRTRGLGLIFISHLLDQVYEVADRITVLRNGRTVGEWTARDLPRRALVEHMVGRTPEDGGTSARPSRNGWTVAPGRGTLVLEAVGVHRRGALAPVDLRLHAGETTGVAGLLGSGRTALCRLLFGLDRRSGGVIRLRGRVLRHHSPRRAVRLGIGLVPEDRRSEGMVPHLSLRENIVLALQARRGWLRPLGRRAAAALTRRLMDALAIDAPDTEKPLRLLSGGNQQKAILARWLAIEPAVLLLDEPTRGIDVGAKRQVERIIAELRGAGMALLLVDSELQELVRQSDRVIVLRDRRAVAELSGESLSEHAVIHAMAEGSG